MYVANWHHIILLDKYVFRRRLNCVGYGASRSISGSLFQIIGPVTSSARLPMHFDTGVTAS